VKSYKTVERKADLTACISGAYSEITSLAEEMQEAYDNMTGGGMSDSHPKVEVVSNARDTLEGKDEPEIDGLLEGIEVTWSEQIPKDKRHAIARWARLSNASAALSAAADTLRAASADEHKPEGDSDEDFDEDFETLFDEAKEELADTLEETVGEIDGVEFPTMFG
jgi:hypothetical protein